MAVEGILSDFAVESTATKPVKPACMERQHQIKQKNSYKRNASNSILEIKKADSDKDLDGIAGWEYSNSYCYDSNIIVNSTDVFKKEYSENARKER